MSNNGQTDYQRLRERNRSANEGRRSTVATLASQVGVAIAQRRAQLAEQREQKTLETLQTVLGRLRVMADGEPLYFDEGDSGGRAYRQQVLSDIESIMCVALEGLK